MASSLQERPHVPPVQEAGAASILDARIRALYRYWLGKRHGRRAPARADIDPIELRSLLPHIYLFDVVEPGPRLRYRLVGTAIAEMAGEVTGRFVDELLPPAVYARMHAHYVDVVRNLVGRYYVADMTWRDRPHVRYHRLLLPLSDDQRAANMLLGISCYDDPRLRAADVTLDRMQLSVAVVDERIVPDAE
jgi:hypothetical protein